MTKKKMEANELNKNSFFVLHDNDLINELLEGISPKSKNAKIRYQCFKDLLVIVKENPETLYPHWDYFVDILKEQKVDKKYIAVFLLAYLSKVDTQNKFDKIFKKYFSFLGDDSIITPCNVAKNAGVIARAKPNLRSKIEKILFNIDKIENKPHYNEIIKGYAIQGFDEYFDVAENKKRIIEFIKLQLKSNSPTTKKRAKEFIKKWNIE